MTISKSILFVLCILFAIGAKAQIGDFNRSLSQLKLTPQQQKQVQQIQQNSNSQMSDLKNRIQSKQKKLSSLLKVDETSDQDIMQLRQEIDSLDEQMNQLKSTSRRQIIKILSKEQQSMLRELQFGR